MNYEEMSDFELNEMVLVATKTNGECHDGSGEVYARDDRNILRLVDYCNNPSDAWPIIFANKIWIQPDMIGDGFWYCYDCESEFSSKHKNPLRSAMIVFLMMQEQGK